MDKYQKRIFILSFILYIIILLWITLFKFSDIDSLKENYFILINMTNYERLFNFIIPFKNIDMKDFLLNIILFIPFGLYMCFLNEEIKLHHALIIGFEISLVIEIIQFLTLLGGFSTNDLIGNSLGSVIGYTLYQFIFYKEPLFNKNIFNIFIIIILVPIVFTIFYSIISNISFYQAIIFKKL